MPLPLRFLGRLKNRAGKRDAGMTLIEVLIAAAISVIIVSVTAAALVVTLQASNATTTRVNESNDQQLVASYLPSDLISVQSPYDTNPSTAQGCSVPMPEAYNYNVLKLQWAESSTNYTVDYRARMASGNEWQLVRYSCTTAAGDVPVTTVVGRYLRPATMDSSTGAPAIDPVSGLPVSVPVTVRVTGGGHLLTMEVTEATGYVYSVTGSRRNPGTTTTAPNPQAVLPAITTMNVYDVDPTSSTDKPDGKLSTLRVTFSDTLPDACLNGFSITSQTGATLGAVTHWAGDGTSAHLQVLETSEAVDTSDTGIQVDFLDSPVAGCDFLPFSQQVPNDDAAPVVMTVTSQDANVVGVSQPGRMDVGDTLTITFSEPIIGTPTSVLVTETGGSPDTLTITDASGTNNLTNGAIPIGSGYVTGNGKVAIFSGSATLDGTGKTVTITLTGPSCIIGTSPSGATCTTPNAGSGSWIYDPAANLTDQDLNQAVQLGTSPQPGATATRIF